MSFDAEQYVHYRVANAPVLRHPFPHFYVEPVFPEEFFRELRARLPDLSAYKRLDETGTVPKGKYPERFVCPVADAEEAEFAAGKGTFWAEFNAWLMGDAFARLIVDKFRSGFAERFGAEVEPRFEVDGRLVRDFTNYAISPHTDSTRKLVSLLFYLPADDSMSHLGTSIYVPKDPGFGCKGGPHYPFEMFRKAATMPFRPNALFAFAKTDHAFHGVDQITDAGVARDLLLYNLYVTKLIGVQPAEPPKATRARFWQREQA